MAELITERIRRNATELRLHGVAADHDELIERAEHEQLGYREFLDLVLESEVGVLEGRRYQSRLKMAGLPHHKTLDEFDVAFQPDLDPQEARRAELAALHRTQGRRRGLRLRSMSETQVKRWWAGLTVEERQEYGELVEHGQQTRDWGPAYAYVVGRVGDRTEEASTEGRRGDLAQTTT